MLFCAAGWPVSVLAQSQQGGWIGSIVNIPRFNSLVCKQVVSRTCHALSSAGIITLAHLAI
jgi:hypothetical protein